MRQITYAQAVNEALAQALEMSPDVLVMGQLVDSKPGVFGTTSGLIDRFGPERVQDFPVAENLMTSAAMGVALAGMRPVVVHHRLDFMLYSFDPIVNWLALWRFKTNGQSKLPVTIRAIIGKGWGQGPQHSKSLHAWFAHLPGLKVAMPATAHDAKGLLLESIFGEDPAIILENRSLFSMVDEVPEAPYRIDFGNAAIRRPGTDVTVVALGILVPIALRVAAQLALEGIRVEVLDLRTVAPIDRGAVIRSVAKTRRLVVADPGWQSVGVAAEIICFVCEAPGCELMAEPVRVCLPDSHTPATPTLEEEYYPGDATLLAAIRRTLSPKSERFHKTPGTSRASIARAANTSPSLTQGASVAATGFDFQKAQERCRGFRRRILDISQRAGALHIAPAFSCLELVDTAYLGLMNRTGDPDTSDTFLLSKGHGSPALYCVLEELGMIPPTYLENICQPGWPLATHPDLGTPGIEASTGSLGHGLTLALGMAYADKMQGKARDIYVVMSDGELQEGSVWEALMTGPSFGINRIVAMVDLNDFQSLGQTSEILPNFYPMLDKLRAFGWEAVEVDGHDAKAIHDAVRSRSGRKPFVLLGRTTKGKGVSFMENEPIWHYRAPNAEEYQIAIKEVANAVP